MKDYVGAVIALLAVGGIAGWVGYKAGYTRAKTHAGHALSTLLRQGILHFAHVTTEPPETLAPKFQAPPNTGQYL